MKKTSNKIISILLSVLMLMAFLPTIAFAETSGDYTYSFDSNGNAEITGFNNKISGDVVIPGEIDGHPVVSIGYWAFTYCNLLTSITIPDGVTSIGNSAFEYCTLLTSVTIPASVTSIGASAFRECKALKTIDVDVNNNDYCSQNGVLFNKDMTKLIKYPASKSDTSYVIPNSVTSISAYAFYFCVSLTDITIPDTITVIEDFTFSFCKSLTSIIVPSHVTSIGNSAFSGCSSMKSITIPDGVTTIGDGALWGCESLLSIAIPASVTTIGNSALSGCSSLTEVTIPYGIKKLEAGVLSSCDALKSVELPNSITEIGNNVFYGCISLTSITIPDSVTEIGARVFYNCESLEAINVGENNDYYCSQDGVLFYNDMTKLIKYPASKSGTSYVIPASVDTIGDEAFSYCNLLIEITVPINVTKISTYAFNGCSRISDVYYDGSEIQWNDIDIDYFNTELTSATIHFNGSQHTEHVWSDWTVTTPATSTENGVETRTCSVCGITETREIPKIGESNEIKDETSGISVQYKNDSFDSEVNLNVEQKFDGESYQIVNIEFDNFKYELFDISITSNGEKVQPNGTVLVKMPIPEGYNTEKLSVYYVTKSGTLEKMYSYITDGYVYFEASHFSDYALIDESESQEPEYMLGDVNSDGKVNAADARLALRISADLDVATEIQLLAADVDGNKKITASDARTILRVSADLEKF